MNFNEYQNEAKKHVSYPNQNTPEAFRYLIYGITGEVGELADHFKNALRDGGDTLTDERKNRVIHEVADLLWYLANICTELNVDFNTIPDISLKKIEDRFKRGIVCGEDAER